MGTGNIAPKSAKDPRGACISVTTETERVHERLLKAFKKGITPSGSSYHRFQVDDHLGSDVSLLDWKKLDLIKLRTKTYISRPEVQDAFDNAAAALSA